eukprot:554285-Amphidinium_carterae.1
MCVYAFLFFLFWGASGVGLPVYGDEDHTGSINLDGMAMLLSYCGMFPMRHVLADIAIEVTAMEDVSSDEMFTYDDFRRIFEVAHSQTPQHKPNHPRANDTHTHTKLTKRQSHGHWGNSVARRVFD